MTEVKFPLSAENVAQVVAERDAEIEHLRRCIAVAKRVLDPDGNSSERVAWRSLDAAKFAVNGELTMQGEPK